MFTVPRVEARDKVVKKIAELELWMVPSVPYWDPRVIKSDMGWR